MARVEVNMPSKNEFSRWGEILGHVEVPEGLAPRLAQLAIDYYNDAEAKDFSGDDVETLTIPAWLPCSRECSWFPDVAPLGFARHDSGELLVATLGVDPHPDSHGPVLMLTLHNDGLSFRQGKARHKPVAGDWFIFDDRTNHAMSSAKGRAAFIGWHVPLTWAGLPQVRA